MPCHEPGQRDDLEAAGMELGHAQGRLVRLRAGVEKHHLLQVRRQQRSQLCGKLDHRHADHSAIEVQTPHGRLSR